MVELFNDSESDRNEGIKLLLKIYQNIINNPSETEKYGDLNFKKISKRLSKCKPALDLLLLSGFEKSSNNRRLIWKNTQNNILILKHMNNSLKSINNSKMSNTEIHTRESSQQPQTIQTTKNKVCVAQNVFFCRTKW